MRDLLLSAGDLSVTNGQLQLSDSFGQAAAQRIVIRLQMFKGEWFLDVNAGTPYFQQILQGPPDMNVQATIFRRVIQGDPYVVSVPTCVCTLTARAMRVDFTAIVRDPATLDSAQVSASLTGGVDSGLVLDAVVVTPNGTVLQ